ncbi:hypothetical protein P5V15_004562 [Pogonomyrmex californicus]
MRGKLFIASLFSLLYIVNFVITTSQEISNNKNKKEQNKPHIVIILADDLGWNDVSFHGSDQIPTPNIDALAYNGIILNNHYALPLCTPSRSSLLTGKHPIHLGMQHDHLKGANYKTHIVGKWHLGYYKREYTPMYRGFDTHFGYYNGLQDYYNHIVIDPIIKSDPPVQGFDMRRNLSVAWDTMGKYSTDLFTEEAVRLINAHDTNNPMFLYLAHLAPHSGNQNDLLQAPAEEIAKFSYIKDPARRTYAAMVSKLDNGIGEVIKALQDRKMLKNSIVLFMSDNGAPTEGLFQNYGSNYPLRGVMAAIWSPLIKKRARVSNQLISIADWLPTLLSAAGINNINISEIDGRNMWPALMSDRLNPRREILINIDDISNYSAIRHGNFKYISCDLIRSPCLFDIKNDPSASLEMTLLQYRYNMVPPSNVKPDPRANPIYWNNTWTYWQDSHALTFKLKLLLVLLILLLLLYLLFSCF